MNENIKTIKPQEVLPKEAKSCDDHTPQKDGIREHDAAKEQRRNRFRKFSAIFKLVLLLVVLIGIPAYVFFFHRDFLNQFSSVDDVTAFFEKYHSQSILFYLGFQIIQIIFCFIPGAAVQFSAGYLFHFWLGLLLSVIGVLIGSIITYYLAHFLGHDAMHMIFGEEKIRSALDKINSKKGVIVVFLIYLIPGVPKDFFTYAAGLSEMKLRLFLILSMAGRLPAMMGSIIIGQQIETGGYTGAAVIGAVAVVCCVLGILFRSRITEFFDRIYVRLKKMM